MSGGGRKAEGGRARAGPVHFLLAVWRLMESMAMACQLPAERKMASRLKTAQVSPGAGLRMIQGVVGVYPGLFFSIYRHMTEATAAKSVSVDKTNELSSR